MPHNAIQLYFLYSKSAIELKFQSKFKVGDWTVEPALDRVSRDSHQVNLPPHAMDLLVFLAQRSRSVVSIDEMIQEVWLGKPMTSGSVYNSLNTLRQAFGDDPRKPKYIETIPKRGYRLIAPVEMDSTETGQEPAIREVPVTPQPAARGEQITRERIFVLVVSGLALALVVALLLRMGKEPGPPVPAREKSIAVLPFKNLSPSGDEDYFADGMHGELLTRLSRISALKVISRTSVMRYMDTDKTLPEIARELSVATILEGGVQRIGDHVRINVQLIDAYTDEHLWAEIYDRELTAENLFSIQSEISTKIAEALNAELSQEEVSRVYDLPTASLEAYKLYLQGRQMMATRRLDDLNRAHQFFEQAVGIDPEFALAWVGMADTGELLSGSGFFHTEEDLEKIGQAIETALALDDQLGEAYTSLASQFASSDQLEEAEAAFQMSIELSPNYAQAYHWYAETIEGPVANLEQRLSLLYKAAQLDPLSSIIQLNIGIVFSNLGRYDDALEQYRQLLKIDPNFAFAYAYIARLNWRNGRLAEAVPWFFDAMERDPERATFMLDAAELLISLGDIEAVALIRERASERLGPESDTLDLLDYKVSFAFWEIAEALQVLGGTPQDLIIEERVFSAKIIANLANGELHKARQYFLHLDPSWADPNQWQQVATTNGHTPGACTMAGILLGTGDQAMGNVLLRESVHFREEVLPGLVQDSDFGSDLVWCYLVDGSYEKALEFYEQRVAHGHIFDWWRDEKLPWWEPVREHPRYIAMVDRIKDLLAEQRRLLEEMNQARGDN